MLLNLPSMIVKLVISFRTWSDLRVSSDKTSPEALCVEPEAPCVEDPASSFNRTFRISTAFISTSSGNHK
jgi:hypothetical protein